ncbi:MAG: DUF2442 domain-containing protein [Pseudomonadota bacterium]
MSSLEFETEEMRPVEAWCSETEIHVRLKDGREIATPLWWHPFVAALNAQDRNEIELMHSGLWWEAADEGVSIKSMFMGWKSPGAVEPVKAA